ncbi:hypothetical protein MN116_002126 [Schistosoma mekongi]|uniref:Uncharacterized protein n=1 Tax=Schistosoma mekongi TaxID=38744 RepID=A0AAE2D8D5_SCHME|nr:hypothetical protein MN116_002126 [Schistosoma mekongi]
MPRNDTNRSKSGFNIHEDLSESTEGNGEQKLLSLSPSNQQSERVFSGGYDESIVNSVNNIVLNDNQNVYPGITTTFRINTSSHQNTERVEYANNQYGWFYYLVELFNMILYSNLNILYQQPGQICPDSGTSSGIQYPSPLTYQYQYQAQQQISGQTQYLNQSQTSKYPTSVSEQNQRDKPQQPTGLQESGTEKSDQFPSVFDSQRSTELKLGDDFDSSLINPPKGDSGIQSTTDMSLFNQQQQKSPDQLQVTTDTLLSIKQTDKPNDFQQKELSTTSSQFNQSDSKIDYSLINLT